MIKNIAFPGLISTRLENPVEIKYQKPGAAAAEAFIPLKAGTKTAHVVVILDDSASMQTIRNQMILAYNEFISGQKVGAIETGVATFVSLYKFNGRDVLNVYSRIPVETAATLTSADYNPQGMTNLLDAIGGVILQTNKELANSDQENRDSIIICTLTDGAENASKVFANEDLKKMISKAEKANWAFQFLGANIDAFAVSRMLGISAQSTMQFNVDNVGATMLSATRMANDLKMAYASGLDTQTAYTSFSFTDQERAQSIGNGKNEGSSSDRFK